MGAWERGGAERGIAGRPAAPEPTAVYDPAKVIRIGTMAARLLAETSALPLDEAARRRLQQVHDAAIRELETVLSTDLARELSLISLPHEAADPSVAQVRLANAQLVGWLEGLVREIDMARLARPVGRPARLVRPDPPAAGIARVGPSGPAVRPSGSPYL